MSLIAVDIDDTLYSFADAAREECLARGLDACAYAEWSDWRTPPDLVGLDEWLSVIETVHASDSILSQAPFANAVDVLWELVVQGHDLMYITTRDPKTAGDTHSWLSINGFPQTGHLRATWDDKQQYITEAAALIDDRPKTAVQYLFGNYTLEEQKEAPRVFMLQRPYNHNLTDIPGIFVSPSWAGFRKGLRKAGLLPEKVAA